MASLRLTCEHGEVDVVVERADDVLVDLGRRSHLLLLLRVPQRLDPAVVLMNLSCNQQTQLRLDPAVVLMNLSCNQQTQLRLDPAVVLVDLGCE